MFIGQVFHALVPVLMQRPITHKAAHRADFCAAKAIREDLIGDAAAEPLGRLCVIVIDGQLPGFHVVPAAVAAFAVAALAAVCPGQAEVVPHQLPGVRRGIEAAKYASPILLYGRKLRLLPGVGKLFVGQQHAADNVLARARAQTKTHLRRAGSSTEGRLVRRVSGVKKSG